jgi:hypothetical protein
MFFGEHLKKIVFATPGLADNATISKSSSEGA